MKILKAKDLRKNSVKDLNIELLNLLKEQFNLRMQIKTTKPQQTHFFKIIRHNIARINTVLTEKANL
jgi:large subunit ribosomal protein L29